MKKLSIIALTTVLVVALGTGMAFADAFNVTSNFGVRVTEKGVSEQVGSATLSPNDVAVDEFTDGQIITVELLGLATISHSIVADYLFAVLPRVAVAGSLSGGTPADVDAYLLANAQPAASYRVVAVEGDDFFTVEVLGGPFTTDILYGHEDASRICFNLEDTIYNSTNPAEQLVKVSYGDNQSNTYSGDSDVATVKPKSVIVNVCDKSNDIDIFDFVGQGPDCGPYTDLDNEFCLTFADSATGSFPANNEYIIGLGKQDGAKAGVGIGLIAIEDEDGDPVTIGAYTRYDRLGNEIVLADFDDDDDFTATQYLYAATAYVEVSVTFTPLASGPQTYTLYGQLYQDTCIITPGQYLIDLTANKVPCGASFTEEDILAATFVTPLAGGTQIFPYAVGASGTYFNGLVISNLDATPTTVNFVIFEADGDMYTGSVDVGANQMAVGFAADVMNPTTTGSDAEFGDEPYSFTATGTGTFVSFIFIGNGTMAQGYIPIMD